MMPIARVYRNMPFLMHRAGGFVANDLQWILMCTHPIVSPGIRCVGVCYVCHRAVSGEISQGEPVYGAEVCSEFDSVYEAGLCKERETKRAWLERRIDNNLKGWRRGLIDSDTNRIRRRSTEIIGCHRR